MQMYVTISPYSAALFNVTSAFIAVGSVGAANGPVVTTIHAHEFQGVIKNISSMHMRAMLASQSFIVISTAVEPAGVSMPACCLVACFMV